MTASAPAVHRLVAACAVVSLLACSAAAPRARQYELRGQITSVRPDAREVIIKHEDIEGFMPAMTMAYPVRDAALLNGKTAGDLVTARLMVGDDGVWLATLEKTGSAPLPEAAKPAPHGIALLSPGDAVPDTPLTDQDGKPLSLRAWHGTAVAITFIYTRCPLPQFCPLMDRRFAEIQHSVAGDAQLGNRVHLLSVSFDPDTDTPAVLRAHAAKLGANADIWRFATADRATVDRFAAAFGVNVIRETDRSITHNLRTAVVGPDGHVVSIYDRSEWTPQQIVGDMRRALAGR